MLKSGFRRLCGEGLAFLIVVSSRASLVTGLTLSRDPFEKGFFDSARRRRGFAQNDSKRGGWGSCFYELLSAEANLTFDRE